MAPLFTKHWGGWDDSKFQDEFDPGSTQIVMVAGEAAGYLAIKHSASGLHLDNLQLREQYTGQGLGTALLREILSRHPKSVICLTTFEDNPALRLYRRLGFQALRTNNSTIHMERRT